MNWLPYQRRDFVTPPFPGYTSGHSAFSRAAAEVLTELTGSPWFPGGLANYTVDADGPGFKLGFEYGPSQPVTLQWASYYDAADEAGQSRIWGVFILHLMTIPGACLAPKPGCLRWSVLWPFSVSQSVSPTGRLP